MNKLSTKNWIKQIQWVNIRDLDWSGEKEIRLALRNKLAEEDKRGSYVYGITAITENAVGLLFGRRHRVATKADNAMFFENINDYEAYLKNIGVPVNEFLIKAVHR